MNNDKLIICVDFDGVIHDYFKGWQNGEIYGEVLPGFFEWAKSAKKDFDIVIYSSRSKDETMRLTMINWLFDRYAAWQFGQKNSVSPDDCEDSFNYLFTFSNEKPAAFLTIDDRVICFKGDWYSSELSAESIKSFKPWNKQ